MSMSERVIEIISKNIEKKCEVSMESRLIEDLGIDSFSKIIITAALEDEFSIEIDMYSFGEIKKVRDIVLGLKVKYPEIEGD
jgi:acyl carrier protein